MPVSLSLHWYHIDTGDSEFDISGWNAFEFADFAMIAAALVTLVAVARSGGRGAGTAGRALLVAGATTVVIVVIQLIDKPPLLGFGLHVSLRIGALLGLAGAILVLAAGALQVLQSGSRQSGSP
jgi:hypothetical protein